MTDDGSGRRRLRPWPAVLAGGAVCGLLVVVAATLFDGAGLPSAGPEQAARPVSATEPATPAATQWVSTNHELQVGGTTRRYLLVRPAAVSSTRLPVVVVLHGRTATPEIEEQRTGLTGVVGRAVLVYPAGEQESWNAGVCCGGAQRAGVDDVTFITDVVHQVLASQRDAAADRVWLVGFSNGGKMAFRLTCADPGLFAAVAVVGAVPVSDCPHPAPVPFIELAIDHDPLLTLTPAQPAKHVNGYTQVSLEELVAAERRINGCTGDGTSKVQGSMTLTTWVTCTGHRSVGFALYQGTVHLWPAGDATTPPAQKLIWAFFESTREGRP